jgi:hypothetical protein
MSIFAVWFKCVVENPSGPNRMTRWVDSFWASYEAADERQRVLTNSMNATDVKFVSVEIHEHELTGAKMEQSI